MNVYANLLVKRVAALTFSFSQSKPILLLYVELQIFICECMAMVVLVPALILEMIVSTKV